MDPESKKLLEDTFQLAEENNRMLRKIRNVQKWAAFWQGLKIFVIIGIAIGAFYYLEPYLDGIMKIYAGISGVEDSLTGGSGSFMDFVRSFQN